MTRTDANHKIVTISLIQQHLAHMTSQLVYLPELPAKVGAGEVGAGALTEARGKLRLHKEAIEQLLQAL